MGPEFNALWDKYFRDKPDKPVMVRIIPQLYAMVYYNFLQFGSIVSGAYADHTLLPPVSIFIPC